MAEYYPLLAKAVGSLSNSTPESRRIVYERARKALIGQLRTLHPPVPDDDIDRESVALDRAIERLEDELANGVVPAPPPASPPAPLPPPPPSVAAKPPVSKPPPAKPAISGPPISGPPISGPTIAGLPVSGPPIVELPAPADGPASASVDPNGTNKPALLPLRTKLLGSKSAPLEPEVSAPSETIATAEADLPSDDLNDTLPEATGLVAAETKSNLPRVRTARDGSRPIAPQPPAARAPKRRLWIIPVAIGLVVAVVGYFAWKLRDHPEIIATKSKPAEQGQVDSGKIAERVGGPPVSSAPSSSQASGATTSRPPAAQPQKQTPASSDTGSQQAATPAPNNPELPVAHRAALLVEAPNEPNKVKTFLGTVVWKLNNVPQGPNDAVGLAVEADIEIPDDKMKAVVTFAKNTEASLPASHTINIRYTIDGGSYTGDVKQISVPQMRPEASASGEPLAGVTVQIVPNSFLVGLSPGNAESANTDLVRRLQWVDIPMLLENGKIAKLTFEKSDSGQRDLTEALDSWQKP